MARKIPNTPANFVASERSEVNTKSVTLDTTALAETQHSLAESITLPYFY
ncbi:hypothetical protein [Pseudoalteromonas umbrosa]|nr:hypothetical protein [Pseudoalteromonas sp. B95]MDK1289685.1 hypothetical protein [Pseudoalteromonas sp. B95]